MFFLQMVAQNIKVHFKLLDKFRYTYKNCSKKIKQFISEYKYKLAHLLETNYKLGLFHLRSHNMMDAEFRFRLVLYFNPNHHLAMYQLARCLYARKKIKNAKKKLKLALKIEENFEDAEYLLKVIDHDSSIQHIPIQTIKEYYDSVAMEFDKEFCKSKGYNIPEILVDQLMGHVPSNSKLSVLDLGCGTGQCGRELYENKLQISSLIGVDVSEKMLEIAKKIKNNQDPIYDKLVNVDYFDYLSKTQHKFDIMVAGLSLHFHKDLSKALEQIKLVLNKESLAAFSIEKAFNNDAKSEINYSFENFCYNQNYIKKTIKDSGMKLLDMQVCSIKNDRMAFVIICKN